MTTILRLKEVSTATGLARSTIYLYVSKGLFPSPVKLGERIIGWEASIIESLNNARIQGKSNAEIKKLVEKLESQRNTTDQGESHE